MSSSQKSASRKAPRDQASGLTMGCWEYQACTKLLCPAHGKRTLDCWFIPRTRCSDYVGTNFFEKLPTCLTCSFFREKGERYRGGFNHFLASQIQRYNLSALELIYQKEGSFIDILDRIPDGLFTTDQEWRITYFNPAAEKITGFPARDAVGMYCRDVFKNTICENNCALKQAVENGGEIHNREYEITDIFGRQVPIICSTSAFSDSEGRITGGLEIFKDITEQKLLHSEIASRERKYRRIFEGSHDMIYTSNHRGDVLDINQAGVEMLGYQNKEELLGAGTAKNLYMREDDRRKFLKSINREGFVKDFEVDFKDKEGHPIHVLISSRRYENPATGDIEYEGVIKDITQRKFNEEIIKQRNKELSILNRVAVALNLSMDLNHILKVTLMDILKVLQLESGAFFLINREEKIIHLHMGHGLPYEDPTLDDCLIFKDNLLKRYLIEEEVVYTPKPTFPPFQVRYRTNNHGYTPWLTCFLILSKGRAAGFLGLNIPERRELTHHEMHLLGSLGNFIGGGIENAQLMKTIKRNQEELKSLTGKLFKSQEEERRRLARELHDEAGQALTAVKLGLDRLEEKVGPENASLHNEVNDIRRMLLRTSSEIRRLSYRLHPTLLSDLGLEPALNLFLTDVRRHSGLNIESHFVGFDSRLDTDTETVLYRFSQEALTNTIKHAQAEKFKISIIKSYPKIIFLAEDDGVGFDTATVSRDKMSLGLLGMRERVLLMGGKFLLKTRPGSGVRIRIEIPYSEMRLNDSIH